jgi:hypothetical protein
MPHYFFDIKDGHRLVDPSGSDCKNDAAAIEKARVLAIGVSLDKPAVDPTRRISALVRIGTKSPRCRFIPSQPSSAFATLSSLVPVVDLILRLILLSRVTKKA